jgi:hypothetical protein
MEILKYKTSMLIKNNMLFPDVEITFKGKSVMSKYTELLNFKRSWAA